MDTPFTFSRRGLLQVGFSAALGLSLPRLVQAEKARVRRAKSLIIVFLTGGPSHHETFDPKPDAPPEIRGEFKTIPTSVPGLRIAEHLPQIAKRMDRCSLIRSMAHREDNHLLATHQVLTGMAIPNGIFDQIASRKDWPCYSATLDQLQRRNDGVPTGVNLPTFLMEGPLVWPGQHAGMLTARHDPWQIRQDPNRPNFRVESVQALDGVERINGRKYLLEQMTGSSVSQDHEKAFRILTSGKVGEAFEIDREPVTIRDRYGRHRFGQSLLLARRLVEAGVSVVQANMGNVQNWDSHNGIFPRLKDKLLPPLDLGVSALLDDLESRGMLDETMVALFGEFGRTPKVNGGAGRDHWGRAFFALFAGGGIRRGKVIGQTDRVGGEPTTHPYSPMDLGATIYEALGIDPGIEIYDPLRRPVKLNTGTPIQELYRA
jgi:hypothetical protein